ncbi:hypothetical protein V5O48_002722 [Marasmius crinis-equi]|uniref:RING-type E3 ubiquitin transferase n=1 Tax=Marasmius crinis-equi TaxID=585013 RepID=A0ABR3FUU1_9AGAR
MATATDRPSTSKSRGTCKYYKTPRGCFAGKTCKFVHGDPEVDKGVDARLTPYDQSKTCRFFAKGYCKRGEKCWFLHTLPSPNQASGSTGVNTPDEELDPIDELCSVCFEKPTLYGLLAGCSHVFCITCIKQWRDPSEKSPDMVDSGVHKKCPMCRSPSSFITPSSLFFKHEDPRKAEIIAQYKQSMARIPCKYFVESKAKNKMKPFCPFGKDCFYQHLNDDGTPHIFQDGVEASMRQGRTSLFSHLDFFAGIFETVQREDARREYEWIDRLLEDPHLGQLQDTLQAVRNSLQQVDRVLDEGGAGTRRDESEPVQRITFRGPPLPPIEHWDLGNLVPTDIEAGTQRSVQTALRPRPLNEPREEGRTSGTGSAGESSRHGDESDDSLPPLQDVEDTEDEDDPWSTTDDEDDEDEMATSQTHFHHFENPIRTAQWAAPGINYTMTFHDDDDDPPPPAEPISDDENDGLPELEPVSDDEDAGERVAIALARFEDSSSDSLHEPEGDRPRPPFVTDGRGRVIGASDGRRDSEPVRDGTVEGRGEGLPRTFLGRLMDAFF